MNNVEIMALKGAELKAKASELAIAGRSKMTVGELREAVLAAMAPQEMAPAPKVVAAPTYANVTFVPQARPMGNQRRIAAYRAQNGTDKITFAQARRLRKKSLSVTACFIGNTSNLGQ